MESLKSAVEKRVLGKAKYTKRTGGPGNYKYQYGPERGAKRPETKAERKVVSRKALREKMMSYGYQAVREGMVMDIKKLAKESPKNIPSKLLGTIASRMRRDDSDQSHHWLTGFIRTSGMEGKEADKVARGIFGEMEKRGLVGKGKSKGRIYGDDLVDQGVPRKEADEFVAHLVSAGREKGMTVNEAHAEYKKWKKGGKGTVGGTK